MATNGGFDLNSVLGAIGMASQDSQAAQAQVAQNRQAIHDVIDGESRAVDANAAADLTIKGQEAQANILAQRQNLAAASSMGTNMSDANQIVTMLGNEMRDNALKAIKQQKVVNEINANSNIGNLPGLFYDALFGDGERATLQGYEDSFRVASDNLQRLNQATQATAVTNNALKVTETDATAAAMQDKIAANAQLIKGQLQERLIGVDTQMIQASNQMSAQQASLAVQGNSVIMSAARFQLEKENAEFNKQMRLEAKNDESAVVETYNRGMGILFPNEGLRTLKDIKLERQINPKRFDLIMQNGLNAKSESGVFVYGSDPLSAVANLQTSGLGNNLPGTQKQVAGKIANAAVAAASISPKNLAGLMNINEMEARQVLADKKRLPEIQRLVLQNKAQSDLTVIDPGNDSSLYAPPPIDFLKGKAELEKNPFLAKYVNPSVIAGGNIKLNPSMLMSQAFSAINTDKMSTNDVAQGITWIAHQIMITNDANNNYMGFGLPTMQEYKKFNTPVNASTGDKNLFGRDINLNQVVDIADPVQVNAYLVQLKARSKNKQFDVTDNFAQDFGNSSPAMWNLDLHPNIPGRDPLPGANVIKGGPNRMLPN